MTNLVVALYGLFLLAGAYFGGKAGSKISVMMGIASGLLTFGGLYLTMVNPKNGFLFLAVLSGLLCGVFFMRFIKTQQFMPSGMLLVVTLLFFIFCLMRFYKV